MWITKFARWVKAQFLRIVLLASAPADHERLDDAAERARFLVGQARAQEDRAQVALHQRRLVGRVKKAPVFKLFLEMLKQRFELFVARRRAFGVAKP